MRQTLALLLDTYRELNAKKLFWITLVLSGVVAASFFFVGINADGLKIGVWQFDNPVNTQLIPADVFYKWVFSSLAIRWWLGLFATALAIISTANFFPDMLKEGAIDLLLAKPIGRLRLFLTRYLTGLFFAFLQVLVFTTICFFVIGIRGGVWEFGLFLAVPFFVLFFSYLFAVSVAVGVFTRSTIAAILITIPLWLILIGINFADYTLTQFNLAVSIQNEVQAERLAYAEGLEPDEQERFEQVYGSIAELRASVAETQSVSQGVGKAASIVTIIKAPLPKTGETLGLLTETLINAAELPESDSEIPGQDEPDPFADQLRSEQEIAEAKLIESKRSVWWIVGTSLLFELIVVGAAAWNFCRRDF